MGMKEWKVQFYKNVSKAAKSDITAVEHALQKWNGLLPENLNAHNLKAYHQEFYIVGQGGARFEINADTCALCVAHDAYTCEGCPLMKTLGKKCYSGHSDQTLPFDIWEYTGDPKPMIKALERTLKRLNKKANHAS